MNTLPRLGLGTAGLALADPSEADRVLRQALDHGIGYFDTAPLYGGGLAEIRLGEVLKSSLNRQVAVSTKVGRYRELAAAAPGQSGVPDVWDFSETATRTSIARSQDRLGREYLDTVFLHDIEHAPEVAFAEALPVLQDLKRQGVVGHIGAGCNTVSGSIAAIAAGAADHVSVAGRWTLLDRRADADLIPLCEQKGVTIIAGGVLNSGILAAPAGATFDYRPASDTEIDAAKQLSEVAAAHGISLIDAALRFPTRRKSVSTLLLGAASEGQLTQSLASLAREIPETCWRQVTFPLLT